jgi:hypothetical protein
MTKAPDPLADERSIEPVLVTCQSRHLDYRNTIDSPRFEVGQHFDGLVAAMQCAGALTPVHRRHGPPVLYPGVFPKFAAYNNDRVDLVAVLLTGILDGVVPGFPGTFTGPLADRIVRHG